MWRITSRGNRSWSHTSKMLISYAIHRTSFDPLWLNVFDCGLVYGTIKTTLDYFHVKGLSRLGYHESDSFHWWRKAYSSEPVLLYSRWLYLFMRSSSTWPGKCQDQARHAVLRRVYLFCSRHRKCHIKYSCRLILAQEMLMSAVVRSIHLSIYLYISTSLCTYIYTHIHKLRKYVTSVIQ